MDKSNTLNHYLLYKTHVEKYISLQVLSAKLRVWFR